jgi:hypothetical protein
MQSTVQDLVDISLNPKAVGRDTRDLAFAMLVRLAEEGSAEARAALGKLRRVKKRNNTADIAEQLHHKRMKQNVAGKTAKYR